MSPRPAATRLHASPRLQRAVVHLHRCGPRAVGEFIAELIDALGADPSELDRLLRWQRVDAEMLAALGADRMPPRPLAEVPR